MDKFFTWEYLGSLAGAVAVVLLIIQFTKVPIDRVILRIFGQSFRLPTRLLVFLLALVILITAAYFLGTLTMETAVISIFNAVLVAWTAMGAYETTFSKIEKKSSTSVPEDKPG
jgi:hypothetical protein